MKVVASSSSSSISRKHNKLLSFLHKDVLVNFYKNAIVNKSDEYLRAPLLICINTVLAFPKKLN